MTQETYSFERFLNVRTAYGPSFSPDGQRLSFLTDITGVAEVWSVPLSEQTTYPLWPQQLTFRGERVAGAVYSPTAGHLLVSGDLGGNERTQLFLLSDDGARFTPLTNRPDAIYTFGDWSPDGARISYSSNERDARYFDVYERDIATGQTRMLLQHDGTNYAMRYSSDGQQLLVSRYVSNTSNQLLLIDVASGQQRALTPEPVTEGRGVLYYGGFWSADRQGLYILSNKDRSFLSLAYLNLTALEFTYLYTLDWDIENLSITADGTALVLTVNNDGYSALEIFDVAHGWEQRQALIAPSLPGGVAPEVQWSPDGQRLAFSFVAPDDTLDIYLWDRPGGMVTRVTQSALGGIPRAALVTPTLVHYPTFDQREIPAFLYLPAGQQRQLPVVVYVHGGPEGQSRPAFNAVVQYLAHRGYAVLVPNVRGSSGYGYEYQSLDDVRLRMDSVADLRAAALWLHDSAIADPARIAVMGGSYGGFMVLSAITTYPDLWAAAVDIVGIANFITFLENTGPWRRKLRESEYGSLENDREFLEQISPIRSVDRITTPLFVVHGTNDPRVPIGEAEQIVSALQQREVPVEHLFFDDEGHGLIKRINRLKAYPAIAQFLDQHLMR